MNKKALTFAIITIIGWSSAFAGVSAALEGGFSPGGLILFRLLTASFTFALYALINKSAFSIPNSRDLFLMVIGGIIGITFYHIGLTYGQQYISAGTASMIVGSAPVFTTIIAVLFLGERLMWYGWVGLSVGFGGYCFNYCRLRRFNFSFCERCFAYFTSNPFRFCFFR